MALSSNDGDAVQSGQVPAAALSGLSMPTEYQGPALTRSRLGFISNQTVVPRQTVAVDEQSFANPLLLDEINGSDSTVSAAAILAEGDADRWESRFGSEGGPEDTEALAKKEIFAAELEAWYRW